MYFLLLTKRIKHESRPANHHGWLRTMCCRWKCARDLQTKLQQVVGVVRGLRCPICQEWTCRWQRELPISIFWLLEVYGQLR